MTKSAKINSISALQEEISNLEFIPTNTSILSKLSPSFAQDLSLEIQNLIRSNYSANRSLSLEYASLGSLLGVSSSSVFGLSVTPLTKDQAIDLLNKISL